MIVYESFPVSCSSQNRRIHSFGVSEITGFFSRSRGSPKVLFENNKENKENISSNVSVNYDDVEN